MANLQSIKKAVRKTEILRKSFCPQHYKLVPHEDKIEIKIRYELESLLLFAMQTLRKMHLQLLRWLPVLGF